MLWEAGFFCPLGEFLGLKAQKGRTPITGDYFPPDQRSFPERNDNCGPSVKTISVREHTVYKEHPVCVPPPEDAVLWRYMDFTKYVSLLARQALFFARVDKLDDPFEGSLSSLNVVLRPHLYRDMTDGGRHALMNYIGPALKYVRQFNLVNCWHENSVESDFMWKLYAKDNAGVAVMTKFSYLATCFACEQDVYVGRVKYVDYSTTLIPEQNSLGICLHKRMAFEHEREVRALSVPTGPAPDHGEFREIDLSVLIREIFVAPYATNWFMDLVESVTEKYGVRAPVRRSTLGASPVW